VPAEAQALASVSEELGLRIELRTDLRTVQLLLGKTLDGE
jgi:hypothetical protein